MKRHILLGVVGIGLAVSLSACGGSQGASFTAAPPKAPAATVGLTALAASARAPVSAAPAAPASPATTAAAPTVATAHVAAATPPPAVAPPAALACDTTDLSVGRVTEDGAMGHIGYHVTVTNRGAVRCRLARPTAYYTKNGAVLRMPTRPIAGTPDASVLVARGEAATMLFFTVNGYAGYPTDSPRCAHPVTYRGVALGIGGGRLPLAGFVLDVKCEGVQLSGWAVA